MEHGGRAARGTAWLRVTQGGPGTSAQEEMRSPSGLIPRPVAGPESCLRNVEPVCKCYRFGSPTGTWLLTINLHFHPSQPQRRGGRRRVLSSLGTHNSIMMDNLASTYKQWSLARQQSTLTIATEGACLPLQQSTLTTATEGACLPPPLPVQGGS